jgi:hypothetical protein
VIGFLLMEGNYGIIHPKKMARSRKLLHSSGGARTKLNKAALGARLVCMSAWAVASHLELRA